MLFLVLIFLRFLIESAKDRQAEFGPTAKIIKEAEEEEKRLGAVHKECGMSSRFVM